MGIFSDLVVEKCIMQVFQVPSTLSNPILQEFSFTKHATRRYVDPCGVTQALLFSSKTTLKYILT